MPMFVAGGGLYAYEAFEQHQAWVAAKAAQLDPRVRVRFEEGARISAADYRALSAQRTQWTTALLRQMGDAAALIMPTVSCVAPALDPLLASQAHYLEVNRQLMRNTRLFNLLDGTALSLPCHRAGDAPVGLMLGGAAMSDARLLGIGRAVEAALVRTHGRTGAVSR